MDRMKTHLAFKNTQKRQLPEQFRRDDVRYPEELVEHFMNEFTKPGEVIFDPFMGYGTTLLVAERLDRVGIGVEFDESRWHYVQSILKEPQGALLGDSTKLRSMELPGFDFSITSPPYMGRHHKENPFTAYTTEGDGYDAYLATLKDIYVQIKEKLKPAAHVVVEVSNLKHEDGSITTLAWDIARELSSVLRYNGEIVVTWEPTYGFGYDHSYCLVFQRD